MEGLTNGARVRFRDFGNVRKLQVTDDAEGTINGSPLHAPDGEAFWPIWSERDSGREATTIYVPERNIEAVIA